MVIGGYEGGRGRTDHTEELKMDSSLDNSCPITDSFPVAIYGAVGANMGEQYQVLS